MTIMVNGKGAGAITLNGLGKQAANGYSVDSQGVNGYGFDRDLVLYLPLHALPTSPMASSDIYGHLATVTGATWGLQGRTFDGTDDFISIATNPSIVFTTQNFTVEMWLNLVFADQDGIFWTGDYITSGFYFQQNGTNGIRFITNQSGTSQLTFTGNNAFSDNIWFHLVVVRNGVTGLIYVNTVQLATTQPAITDPASSVNDPRIFSYGGGSFSQGIAGEVRIYSRALSVAEITQNYLATKWRYGV